MKRNLLLAALGFALAPLHLQAQTPTISSNVAVVINIDVPPGGAQVFVALNMNQIGGETLRLESAFKNVPLISSPNSGDADKVLIYNPLIKNYRSYYQKPDGFFYEIGFPLASPVNPPIRTGESFWIHSSPNSTVSRTFSFVGEVVGDAEFCQDLYLQRGNPGQLDTPVSIPYITGFPNLGIDWIGLGAKAGQFGFADSVHVWRVSGQVYDTYFLHSSGEWRDGSFNLAPDPLVGFGQGIIYTIQSVDDSPFRLCLPRPYDYPTNE